MSEDIGIALFHKAWPKNPKLLWNFDRVLDSTYRYLPTFVFFWRHYSAELFYVSYLNTIMAIAIIAYANPRFRMDTNITVNPYILYF